MSHAHARTKVRIGNSFGSNSLKQSTYDRITSRIPTGRDDRNRVVSLSYLVQRTTQGRNIRMDVETVDRVNAHSQNFLGILLYLAGRRTENGYIDIVQFADMLYNLIFIQFGRTVFGTGTAHHTGNFEVGGSLQSLEHIVPDVAITNNGSSYFFHTFMDLICHISLFRAQK